MDENNYIENQDVKERKPSAREIRKAEKERDIQNNEEILKAAENVLSTIEVPYASEIARTIKTVDSFTGGMATRQLAKDTRTIIRYGSGGLIAGTAAGKNLQKRLNRINESGIPRAVNRIMSLKQQIDSKNGGQNANKTPNNTGAQTPEAKAKTKTELPKQASGELKIERPSKTKIIIIVAVIVVAFICLLLFVVLFNGGDYESTSSAGSFTYGSTTCTQITVTNTGCDSNSQNCTNQYDGTVSLEDYVAGVVAAKLGDTASLEEYKASAVIARTSVQNHVGSGCTVKGNAEFQEYIDVDESTNATLIRQAVEETKGLVIIKDNQLISETTTECQLNNSTSSNYSDAIKLCYGDDVEIKTNRMQLAGIGDFMNPTRYINCSSAFGYRIHPVKNTSQFHSGLDIAITGGEPIYAANDGVIKTVVSNINAINNCNYGYGNYIMIDHSDGTSTLYAHIKYGSIPSSIYTGAEIQQGEQIGQVGSTGCSTGNHVHYEARVNNEQVDPANYLNLTDATGTCKR